jgi:hypothetical protein
MNFTDKPADVEQRLEYTGIELPPPPKPLGAYAESVQTDAARLAALNALALAKAHLKSLNRVKRLVRLGVSLVTSEDFREHPKVADGASELLAIAFGAGKLPSGSSLCMGVSTMPGATALTRMP